MLGNNHDGSAAMFVTGILILCLGAAIFVALNQVRLKIKELRQEKLLRE
jgi:cell division protein FtsX